MSGKIQYKISVETDKGKGEAVLESDHFIAGHELNQRVEAANELVKGQEADYEFNVAFMQTVYDIRAENRNK